MIKEYNGFPPQQLSYKSKGESWGKACVNYGAEKATILASPIRKSVVHKKINYDLLNGILHMSDLEAVVNPDDIKAGYIPEKITHYPLMNSKLNVLRGEESKRPFEYKVIVTNPNSISEIEEEKKNQIHQTIQQLIQEQSSSEDEFNQKLAKVSDYFTYEYQDFREIRANAVLNHFSKEINFPIMFNRGFMDALAVSEEIYQCDIVGGEPVVERLNPLNVRIFRSGYSNKIEDADMIVIEDYWSPGKVIDTYGEYLKPKDFKYIDSLPTSYSAEADSMAQQDERRGFINNHMVTDVFEYSAELDPEHLFDVDSMDSLLPYDLSGNLRVCKVYWKSRRKIKKVKSYDPQTGEEIYNFYTEDYKLNTDLGEEETTFWINEAWEGVKIGQDIFVNIRPRVIQYNRMSNPSRCHFGIIGSIYNLNESKPFSMVDMMKYYNYLYDAIHDRLNRLISRNWGKLIQLDLAKVPKGWDIDKWMYYARTNNLVVTDSFKEGNYGPAAGKLAGALNNNTSGVIDGELGQSIQQYINILEFIKLEMSEIVGISKQREGQISNRETVGGVERATLQSSHITEWLFTEHEDVKKRVIECFIETAKIAAKGRNLKFQYILPDHSQRIMELDGDEFAECDYGLVVDNSSASQTLNQKLDTLAQAALQNQALSFSTIMKLYSSCSLAEKQRFIENDERQLRENQQQAQQQQLQAQQQQVQAELEQKQAEMQLKDAMNQRDNETKILIATIQSESSADDGIQEPEYSQEAKDKLAESIREFDAKLALDKERLNFDKQKAETDARLKEKQINKSSKSSSK